MAEEDWDPPRGFMDFMKRVIAESWHYLYIMS